MIYHISSHRVGLVVSVSTSHTVGCGFAYRPGYTKDHFKNDTNCLPAWHAMCSGYNTLLLRMIPGDLLSAFPHRQFHTLPGLLDSWAALPNSNPNAGRQFAPFL